MDGRGFDNLARSMTKLGSRRVAQRALAGAALGAVGAIGGSSASTEAAVRCPRGKERCDGKCRTACPGVKVRNRRTCRCECPDGMKACGSTCVGEDRCCPGEKACGGGCISVDSCCPYTHHECPDGSCLEKDSGACCPGVEVACPSDPGGCCNSLAGEECTDAGCCNTLLGQKVCGDQCRDGPCAQEGGCCPSNRQGPDLCCPSGQSWWADYGACCNSLRACGDVCCPQGQSCTISLAGPRCV